MGQWEILEFLRHKAKTGSSGYFSIPQIIKLCSVSRRSVEKQVRVLFDWGFIEQKRINRRVMGYRATAKESKYSL